MKAKLVVINNVTPLQKNFKFSLLRKIFCVIRGIKFSKSLGFRTSFKGYRRL
jgi:hypothetical protein